MPLKYDVFLKNKNIKKIGKMITISLIGFNEKSDQNQSDDKFREFQ